MHILREDEVRRRLGLSKSTLWRLRKAGAFPEPIELGPRAKGYLADEIDAYIEKRRQARDSFPKAAA